MRLILVKKSISLFKSKVYVSLFFAALLVIGCSIYKDYGMAWDDYSQRDIGGVTIKHIDVGLVPNDLASLDDLHQFRNKDYGPAFEVMLVVLEKKLNLLDTKHIYEFRHLAVFIAFCLGVFAVNVIARNSCGDYRWGLLAALMMVLSPRIFAESFYNTKDIVFMSSMAFALLSLTSFLSKPCIRNALIHGFFTGFAIDIRIMGVVILFLTLLSLGLELLNKRISWRKLVVALSLYLLASGCFTVVMWPYLWADPWGNFLHAFNNMARFRWNSDQLYLGELVRADQLPWHYAPIWILVTTPIIYTMFMLVGAFAIMRQSLSCRFLFYKSTQEVFDFILLSCLFAPLVGVIVLHSVLYDGWRQLYFIYPAFILIAVKGIYFVFKINKGDIRFRNIVFGLLITSFSFSIYWMWSAHPLQNTYFNFLIGGNWKDKFELDYWGLGNKGILQYILDHDDGRNITIKSLSFTPIDNSFKMLSMQDRKRISLAQDDATAIYLLNNYRQSLIPNDITSRPELRDYTIFYNKTIGGEIIISVLKRKNIAERSYTTEELKGLNLEFVRKETLGSLESIVIRLKNNQDFPILAASAVGTPIRIAWRYIDQSGRSQYYSDYFRKDLPFDIEPHGSLDISIPLIGDKISAGKLLEISWVQDGAFWMRSTEKQPLIIKF